MLRKQPKQFNRGSIVASNSCGVLPTKVNQMCLLVFTILQPGINCVAELCNGDCLSIGYRLNPES